MKKKLLYFVLTLSIFLFCWGLFFFLKFNNNLIDKFKNWGEVGSYLSGTAGVLFSAATIILLIYSIIQTRDELALQIKEMKGQKDIFEKQMRAISIEQSESTLFKLIDNHKKYIEALSDGGKSGNTVLGEHLEAYRTQLKNYSTYYSIKQFDTYEYLGWQPHYFFNLKYNVDFYSPIFNSLILVIRYIDEKLKKNLEAFIEDKEEIDNKIQFYHSIFYYSLTNFERYFIGLLYQNKLIFTYPTLNALYLEYYSNEPNDYKYTEAISLPVLDILIYPNRSKKVEFDFPVEQATRSPHTLSIFFSKAIEGIYVIDYNQKQFKINSFYLKQPSINKQFIFKPNSSQNSFNILNDEIANFFKEIISSKNFGVNYEKVELKVEYEVNGSVFSFMNEISINCSRGAFDIRIEIVIQ